MEETDSSAQIRLPEAFLLGAGLSAHQAEGNNLNSDWWHFEQQGRLPKSGLASDHYNRFGDDFEMAKSIGLNAVRISIEWSRIEPLEGRWDSTAIEHYRKVLKKMKEQGLSRMVTLHHFTLPMWLAEKGGFESRGGAEAFARFAWFVAQNLGDEIDLWCTINEPGVYTTLGYIFGIWPPFKPKHFLKSLVVFHNLIRAHKSAFDAIKSVRPNAQIGAVNNCSYYEPHKNFIKNSIIRVAEYFNNRYFFSKISKYQDFLGVNYYFHKKLSNGFKGFNVNSQSDGQGWITYPKGIFYVVLGLAKFRKPIYITENGIANAEEPHRANFIKEHLYWLSQALDRGADVRGYFYWSLIDSYELHDGFNRFFGLAEVNYETQERKVRSSAKVFQEIKNKT